MPDKTVFQFKQRYSLENRQSEFRRIQAKFPNKIPIIVERSSKSSLPDINKNKFLVGDELSVGQFIYILRKRISLDNEKGLFLYINGVHPTTSMLLRTVYDQHHDEDGFLYIIYYGESIFG